MSEQIKGILDITMDKLRAMVDADTVVGTPITVGEVTLIPVSKISFGLASGGSDFNTTSNANSFGGGAGAGVSVTPINFICINGTNVKMLPVTNETSSLDRAIAAAPELIETIKSSFNKEN